MCVVYAVNAVAAQPTGPPNAAAPNLPAIPFTPIFLIMDIGLRKPLLIPYDHLLKSPFLAGLYIFLSNESFILWALAPVSVSLNLSNSLIYRSVALLSNDLSAPIPFAPYFLPTDIGSRKPSFIPYVHLLKSPCLAGLYIFFNRASFFWCILAPVSVSLNSSNFLVYQSGILLPNDLTESTPIAPYFLTTDIGSRKPPFIPLAHWL